MEIIAMFIVLIAAFSPIAFLVLLIGKSFGKFRNVHIAWVIILGVLTAIAIIMRELAKDV